MRLNNARSWLEISLELTTEDVETNFEVVEVMKRSSKDDLIWCESCQVETLICDVKQVKLSMLARSSFILLVPDKLKPPQIIR